VVCEENEVSSVLIAELGIQVVWTSQTEALFDIRVMDTDADSYVYHSVAAQVSKL